MSVTRPRMQLVLRSSIVLALACSVAQAQGETGFLRGKGKLDAALSYTVDTYDEFWVGKERVSMPMVGEVERETYSLYLAYGLRDDIDIFLSGALVESESDGAAGFEAVKDMQDFVLGAKWRFVHEPFARGHFSLLAVP